MDNSDEENSTSDAADSGEVSAKASDYWYSYRITFDASSGVCYISSAEELACFAYMVNTGYTYAYCIFRLIADIDLSAHYWVPIGGHEYDNSATNTDYYFAGEFDGNGHVITGLTTYNDGTSVSNYAGLFGYAAGTSSSSYSYIHDLGIEDSEISGYDMVGAIVGYGLYTCIYNCYNSGNVTGRGYVGGIVGRSNGGADLIYNNYNTGSITGSGSRVGGIVGVGIYARYCYNTGEIIGSTYVGGIAGDGTNGAYECYNLGSVTGAGRFVGGITGGFSAGNAVVYNCYNVAYVVGGYYVGGIVGGASSAYYIYNCFSLGEIVGTYSSSTYYMYVGGICGGGSAAYRYVFNCYYYGAVYLVDGSTVQMGVGGTLDSALPSAYKTCVTYSSDLESLAKTESWFTDTSNWDSTYLWDFDDVWAIYSFLNDEYPILQWQFPIKYDEEGDYWYVEDGELPQSAVTNADLISNLDEEAVLISYLFYVVNGDNFYVWVYSGSEYIKVTADGKSGTASDAGTWFLVEPIRWVVGYGSAKPTSYDVAVSAYVLTCGSVADSAAGSGWDWSSSSLLSSRLLRSVDGDLEGETSFTIASEASWSYDAFVSTVGQSFVTDDATTGTSVVSVASVEEIDALGGSYKAQCSDFVAFLISGGKTTSGYAVDYWTRDLAFELDSSSNYGSTYGASSYEGYYNSGVYVGADGLISNAWLTETMGARLSVKLG